MVEGQPSNNEQFGGKKVGIKMLKTSLQLFRLKITIKLELIKKTKARK